MALAFDEFGRPYIILREQEQKSRVKGLAAQKANILAARSVAQILRSSLGPKGMDKMLQSGDGDVTISAVLPLPLLYPALRDFYSFGPLAGRVDPQEVSVCCCTHVPPFPLPFFPLSQVPCAPYACRRKQRQEHGSTFMWRTRKDSS